MILQSVEAILFWVAFRSFGATMREIGGHILFSATDLMRFMGCAHAAFKLIFPKLFAQPSSHSAFEEAGIKHKSLVEQVSRAD
jgi:hypothetical protein